MLIGASLAVLAAATVVPIFAIFLGDSLVNIEVLSASLAEVFAAPTAKI